MHIDFDIAARREELHKFFGLGLINQGDASWNTYDYEFNPTTPKAGTIIDGHKVRGMSTHILHAEPNADGTIRTDAYRVTYSPAVESFTKVDKFSSTSIPLKHETTMMHRERSGDVVVDSTEPGELQILQDVLLAAILFTEPELSDALVKKMIAAIPEFSISNPTIIQ